MKKISKWTLVGYVGGIVFVLIALSRYLKIFPDYDRAISYGVIGILICCVSWLYNKTKSLENTLSSVEDYLADISDEK